MSPAISNNQKKITATLRQRRKDRAFVSVGKDMNQATETYATTNQKLSALKEQGLIKEYASASQFLISPQEQQKRLKKWKDYWTDENSNKSVNSWKQLPPNIVSAREASNLFING